MATQPMSRRHVGAGARQPRDPKLESTDVAALRAIAQAAVEVELFTIPLYMTTLYSIQGMHQITGKNNAFYQNRLWPGPTATARPETPNETAFNIIFSVFIQEMLHLQLAANMATAIGHTPDFTASALQAKDTHAWTCYGPDKTIIPYIVDLRDTRDYKDVKVNLGPVSAEQLKLFLAIEQPEELAQANIEGVETKYPIKVPFENWEPGKPLPMFGTIGRMYQCYHDYLHLKYTNGSTLWEKAYNPGGQQNDLFNNFGGSGHPMREFMGFESTIALTYPDIAFRQMLDMMDAITDQGEGSVLKSVPELLTAVEKRYQPSLPGLESDYPDFDDIGKLIESADAPARYDNDSKDHYERFQQVAEAVDRIQTWGPWLKQHGPWTAADLVVAGKEPPINPKLPSAADVAAALNTLAAPDAGQDYYKLLSQAAIGAIAGVTTVLEQVLECGGPAEVPCRLPVPFDGRGGRSPGDLLGGVRQGAGPEHRPRAAGGQYAVSFLPGDRLHIAAAGHQCLRAGDRLPCLPRFQRLPRARRVRLCATHDRWRKLQHHVGRQHGNRNAHFRRRVQSFRRRRFLRARRQQVRHIRRLRRADLGLAALSEERTHAVIQVRQQRGRMEGGADRTAAVVRRRRQRARCGLEGL